MATKSIGKAKLKTKGGRTILEPARSYDVSKQRKIAKSKKQRVVSRMAASRGK